jgi:single-strand DNA-binding protein
MNKVILIGNLTADIEIRYTPSGAAVANFSMAMNRKWKQNDEVKEEVTFVEIVVWQKQAEMASQYLHKGSKCLVEGRLNQDRWEDKETGKSRSRINVVAERIEFLDKKEDSNQQAPQPQRAPAIPPPGPIPQAAPPVQQPVQQSLPQTGQAPVAPGPYTQPQGQPNPNQPAAGVDFNEDDIPF